MPRSKMVSVFFQSLEATPAPENFQPNAKAPRPCQKNDCTQLAGADRATLNRTTVQSSIRPSTLRTKENESKSRERCRRGQGPSGGEDCSMECVLRLQKERTLTGGPGRRSRPTGEDADRGVRERRCTIELSNIAARRVRPSCTIVILRNPEARACKQNGRCLLMRAPVPTTAISR